MSNNVLVFFRVGAGEGGLEEDSSVDGESLEIWVKDLACRVDPTSLEGVSRYEYRMCVIYTQLL